MSSPGRRRVAVTGLGMVTPLGNGVASTWKALMEGHSGVRKITLFDASGFSARIAAEVKDFNFEAEMDRKLRKHATRQHCFALTAAREALRDAGVDPKNSSPERWGCVVGSGMISTSFRALADLHGAFVRDAENPELDSALLAERGVSEAADPMEFCRTQSVTGLSLLLRSFSIRGYSATVHTACASGGQALGTAMKSIRSGRADRMLAGGFDSMIHPLGLGGFCLLEALSTRNHSPETASRPFDATRNGFVLGEGAGFLVLEEWEAAKKRSGRIYAELAGEGNSLSAYRITDSHPSGDGPIQAMSWALRDARVEPAEVDYINAHGTSTRMNDRSECRAIETVFAEQARKLAVSSTKSQMGHLIAAAGAVEAAICALTIHHGRVPPTVNLEHPDPECDLDFVPRQCRELPVRVALSNSFGFGGSNNCLVFRKPDDDGAESRRARTAPGGVNE